ncbi:MAG: peptidyl-prolyl cis-trans isomerase [Polyangiaceae bacterium]|nr:peptidyl-prolyl cis-trans isomerase [Polyangiaceae bacterium]
MGKVSSLLLALLVLGTVVAVAWRRPPGTTAVARAEPDAGVAADGPAAAPPGSASPAAEDDAGTGPDVEPTNDAGGALPDGSKVPGLPGEAPKQVGLGVVLVRYAGAEGARPGTRSKQEAATLAAELAELAKTDFKAAVQKGDKGSAEQAGSLPRGVLEPGPEYVLFTLAKGAVGGPIDTPTGFWIVRRAE